MRLIILAAAVLVALPTASSADRLGDFAKARQSLRPTCPVPPGKHYAIDPGKPLKPQKLGELPPAEAYQAVLRTDGKGCLDPLLVEDRLRRSR